MGLDGGLLIADLPDRASWIYLDNAAGGHIASDAESVDSAIAVHDALRSSALPTQQTETQIREVLGRHDPH